MKYAVRMTWPVQQVLRALLDQADLPRYGLEISKLADLETGTLYPVMARLEGVGWVESSWEDPELSRASSDRQAARPDADVELIQRAYDVAAHWHQGQTRRSGDPYITHPLAVATILAGIGADDQMLCAAMLHDTIEDTRCTLTTLSLQFGAEVEGLLAGITALGRIKSGRGRKAAQLLAAVESADPRVLAIKLADRLHNMRTVQFIPQAKQLRRAREALDIFVPVASRLSLDTIEAELEILSRATMKRNRYTRSVSGHLLIAVTTVLPAAESRAAPRRSRWRGPRCSSPPPACPAARAWARR